MCSGCDENPWIAAQIKRKYKSCDPSPFAQKLRKRSQFLYDFVYGLESKIPFCCVLEYCFRSNFLNQAVNGVVTPKGMTFSTDFVPCWFHRRRWLEAIK